MYLFKKKCLMNLMNAQDSFRTVINNVQLKKKIALTLQYKVRVVVRIRVCLTFHYLKPYDYSR